ARRHAGARAAPGDRRPPGVDDAVPPRPPRDRGQRPLPDGARAAPRGGAPARQHARRPRGDRRRHRRRGGPARRLRPGRPRRGGAEGSRLLAAIDTLEATLLPHLRREEDEAMPLVAAALTDAELRRWDEEDNIKPKSLRQLGREAHWILDGVGPDDRDFVLGLV